MHYVEHKVEQLTAEAGISKRTRRHSQLTEKFIQKHQRQARAGRFTRRTYEGYCGQRSFITVRRKENRPSSKMSEKTSTFVKERAREWLLFNVLMSLSPQKNKFTSVNYFPIGFYKLI